MNETQMKEISRLIEQTRCMVEELKEKSGGIQAVEKNADRILANIKMLELNISDIIELL